MSPAHRPGRGLWRALALFWVVVVLGAGGTVGVLAWFGAPPDLAPRSLMPPPAEPPSAGPATPAQEHLAQSATAPVPVVTPAPAQPVPERAAPPEAPALPHQSQASPAAPATPHEPLALPEAPEPPPLPSHDAATAEHPIAAPDPALLEPSPAGMLPRIGADGRQPRHAYARAFDRADTRPRVALVMPDVTEPALRRLPGPTALALGSAPTALLEAARARGMETLLQLPADMDPLEPLLARFAGYVGVLGAGEVPAAAQQALRARGLLVLDPRPDAVAPRLAWGRAADLLLEDAPTRGEIDRQLAELERLARERGSALGLLPGPRPLLVERVAAWAAGLPERGLVLAPVTAMIRRPSSAER